ncbi:3-oxoacyl-(acyl-carrier-) reductase [Fusarium albosuccineum]|uniref:3-oxoacyl-(Acyl-carrier-) reductase n=1 Tax=Fusarium albosuccineum TaxID=1237068 RepID=A0A8H4LDQ0_9HYPO|nr:3-oxoacyl-(acyl-carrier-) reductase [Fusarium albosuccineum]
MAPQVWLITGATSGIGAALVDHLLARGDKVIASGRKVQERLGHLQSERLALLELDITADLAEIQAKIKKAWDIFGNIDVLMNNAGMSALKSVEESDEALINTMFQVNLFGHMRVTQAILPLLRAQGHGCIAFTSSGTAWAAIPFMTLYASSKAALSSYAEGLHKEVRPLGIRCVAFECGGFPTSLGQPRDSSAGFGSIGSAIEGYATPLNSLLTKMMKNAMDLMPGDLSKAATTIGDVVKRENLAAGKPRAVRVAIGSDGTGWAQQKCEEMQKLLKDWKDISRSTDRDGTTGAEALEVMHEYITIVETEH